MKVLTPYTFRDGEILDPRRFNANLREVQEVSEAIHAKRITRWAERHPLAGLADTGSEGERSIPVVIRTSRTAEIVGVRLVIYAVADITWTLASSDITGFTSMSVVTAGATTRAEAVFEGPRLPVSSTLTKFVLSASAASTIVAGWVEVTYQSDRHAQGDTSSPYAPAVNIDETTPDTVAPINAEFTAQASFLTTNAAAGKTVLVERYTSRSTGTKVWKIPARPGMQYAGVAVFAAGSSGAVTVNLVDNSVTVATATASNTTSGASAASTTTPATPVGSDPNDSSEDLSVELIITGAALNAVAFVFWE